MEAACVPSVSAGRRTRPRDSGLGWAGFTQGRAGNPTEAQALQTCGYPEGLTRSSGCDFLLEFPSVPLVPGSEVRSGQGSIGLCAEQRPVPTVLGIELPLREKWLPGSNPSEMDRKWPQQPLSCWPFPLLGNLSTFPKLEFLASSESNCYFPVNHSSKTTEVPHGPGLCDPRPLEPARPWRGAL